MAMSPDHSGPGSKRELDTTDPDEQRYDLEFKRERDSYALERGRREDKDMRVMRWIVFCLLIAVFIFSLLGITVFNWTVSGYILTAFLSAIAGNMIQVPITALFGTSSSTDRSN